MNHFKTVIKNNQELSDVQFKRHLYLAYQWIKRKDLTKAENPNKTRQCIRLNLLVEIINFFSNNKVSTKEINDYLTEKKYKIRKQSFDHYEMREWFNIDRERNPRFNNYYFFRLHPQVEIITKKHKYTAYIINHIFRETLINPEIIINEKNEDFILNFKNKSGSCLSLKFEENFKHGDPVQFQFVLINKMQSNGVLTFLRPSLWSRYQNVIFDCMIQELLNEDKAGGKNEKK